MPWSVLPVFLTVFFILGCGQSSGASTQQPPSSPPSTVIAPATAYYVDCSASTNGTGSQSSPWNSLSVLNSITFLPGDQVLFKSGATCAGGFQPLGSGTSAQPIILTAWGSGSQPVIDGGTASLYALHLNGVQYYEVKGLSIRGGSNAGVRVDAPGSNTVYEHIHISNVDVTAVNAVAAKRGDSGGIMFAVTGAGSNFDDVLIDSVTVHDFTASQGIDIEGPYSPLYPAYNTNVTVQNSTVHDVYGDGILLGMASGGLVQHNVVYRSGLCSSCTGSTPVGIWCWFSKNVTFQFNETYANQTWTAANTDGGDFDVDMWNQNIIYQYNYGHDSQGYCFLIEGYDNKTADTSIPSTSNTIIRYNICANNVTKDTGNAEVLISTYGTGFLNGVQIYGNTFYVAGVPGTDALLQWNENSASGFTGTTPNFIENNLVYSTQPGMINVSNSFTLNHNLYWNAVGSGYSFNYNGVSSTTFAGYQTSSGQDAAGINADPLLNGAGYHSAGMPSLTSGNYTLKTGSPAIGTGEDVCAAAGGCISGSMGVTDFFGQTPSANHNIGAFD